MLHINTTRNASHPYNQYKRRTVQTLRLKNVGQYKRRAGTNVGRTKVGPVQTSDGTNLRLKNVGQYERRAGTNVGRCKP